MTADWSRRVLERSKEVHARVPGLRELPWAVVGIVGLVAFVNVLVWIGCGVVLVSGFNWSDE